MTDPSHPMLNPTEPTWDVANLFPAQGRWTASDYLNLTDDLNQLVELVDGRLEILEMPTTSHQQIVFRLLSVLVPFVESRKLGTALMAPLRVQLRPGLFREPDIVFASIEHAHLIQEDFWTGADLVVEVVSAGPKSRRRDLHEKRREYAEAGIAEYWIVDPMNQSMSVLTLQQSAYVVAGEFAIGESAESIVLADLKISVQDLFS